ncbi:MAG TPA: prolipoprotein diacylglyceryl transferase [Acidobacteriota bacterium]|nr:prolipoprotein diacylglyceryl transferase [Acidobacteriota bacterium]
MLPKLFDIGPLPIHTYGLLLATALLVAIAVMAHLAESDGVPRKFAWDLGFIIIISSIVGAKLLLVLTSLDYYLASPSRLFSIEFLQAAGVYYGGLLGAMVGTLLFLRKHKDLSFWRIADIASPTIPLGQAIGRVGCFAAGCDYGTQTTVPWAVTFTSEYAHREIGVPINVPLHPYQLYESGASLLLFLFLFWFFRKRTFTGQVFCLYLICYGVLRFNLEFFRGDVGRGFLFGGLLSTSQFISVLLVPTAVIAYLVLKRKAEKKGA